MEIAKHRGCIGVPYEELENHIGSSALVVERVSEPKKRGVYDLHFGVIERAPIAPSEHEKGYALTNRVDSNGKPGFNLLISPDYMVFVKR